MRLDEHRERPFNRFLFASLLIHALVFLLFPTWWQEMLSGASLERGGVVEVISIAPQETARPAAAPRTPPAVRPPTDARPRPQTPPGPAARPEPIPARPTQPEPTVRPEPRQAPVTTPEPAPIPRPAEVVPETVPPPTPALVPASPPSPPAPPQPVRPLPEPETPRPTEAMVSAGGRLEVATGHDEPRPVAPPSPPSPPTPREDPPVERTPVEPVPPEPESLPIPDAALPRPEPSAPADLSSPEVMETDPDSAADLLPAPQPVDGTGEEEEGPEDVAVPPVRGSDMVSFGGHLIYPKTAQDRGYTGTVLVEVTVDGSTGRALEVQVGQTSGQEVLDQAALLYLTHRASFQPAASDYVLQVEVVFRRSPRAGAQTAYEVDVVARDGVRFVP